MPPPIALSARVSRLKPPATLAIMARAKALAKSGAKVISFGLGEPDFDTPQVIRRAAIDALESGQTHYMPTVGDLDTRAAIADKLTRENHLPGITPDHVTISAGAKHSLYLVCQCLLDADGPNEVLLPVPAWVSYGPIAALAGGKVIELATKPEHGFRLTPDQLRAAITPRSRLLILNTPSNPCGTMYSPDELRALARVVADAAKSTAPGLVVVVDEIYEKIIYGGIPHFSIGSVPEIADRTVTINGLSKAFAMTGWRIGYAACSGEFGLTLARGIDALQGQMTSCITSFLYPAIRVALRDCAAQTEEFRKHFANRARICFDLVAGIPGLSCTKPTGAFYLFPDVSGCYGRTSAAGKPINNGVDFAEALLNEAHVAVVPGQEFGGCGERHIRISFACSEAQLTEGLSRLARFVAGLR
ncbi:MAG: pyridoxal phosphate-dependent aminotransferase [Phycisphaerales bacterium]